MPEAVRVEDVAPEAASSSSAVSLEDVVKRFGEVVAVDGVTLDIDLGEFFSLLGS